MSTEVGIWKTLVSGVRKVNGAARATTLATSPAGYDPVSSVVRQVFFPAVGNPRTRVLFAAAGPETDIRTISERIGKVLSDISGESVGVIGACPKGEALPNGNGSRRTRESDLSATGVQIAERVWRIPPSLLSDLHAQGKDMDPVQIGGELPFRYLVFASHAHDGITPLFCRVCEGAVLVLTAGQTRRESACRAKEVLEQCHGEVLGALLDGMDFPIPEAIYRRL